MSGGGLIPKGTTEHIRDRQKFKELEKRGQPGVPERPASEMDQPATGSPDQSRRPGIVRRLIRRIGRG